jgi:hypothetical protein
MRPSVEVNAAFGGREGGSVEAVTLTHSDVRKTIEETTEIARRISILIFVSLLRTLPLLLYGERWVRGCDRN